MKIIGVTGGIGAGKSTVSAFLKDLGALVFDADLISKQVVEPFKPAWHEIVQAFGEEVLLPDKALDRKKMAEIVFNSEEKKKKLEKIIHVRVLEAMAQGIDKLSKEGYRGVLALDVPIPVKEGFLDTVDSVWVVVCSEAERIRRVMKRSGLSYEEAQARINAQMSQEDYIKIADRVIYNENSHDELKQQVITLFKNLEPGA